MRWKMREVIMILSQRCVKRILRVRFCEDEVEEVT